MEQKLTSVSYFTNAKQAYSKEQWDLNKVVQTIKQDPKLKTDCEYLRNETTEEKRRDFKQKNLPYVTFSGIFKHRAKKDILESTGLAQLDLDGDYNSQKWVDLRKEIQKLPFVALCFTSPSGALKVIVRIPRTKDDLEFKKYWFSLSDFFIKKFHIEPDKAAKDISRACFLSYDENIYYNPHASEYTHTKEVVDSSSIEKKRSVKSEVSRSDGKGSKVLNSVLLQSLKMIEESKEGEKWDVYSKACELAGGAVGAGLNKDFAAKQLIQARERRNGFVIPETQIKSTYDFLDHGSLNPINPDYEATKKRVYYNFQAREEYDQEKRSKELKEVEESLENELELFMSSKYDVLNIMNEEVKEDFICKDILNRGEVTIISGARASGKTFLALWMALNATSGNDCFDKESKVSKTLYIDSCENGLKVLSERYAPLCSVNLFDPTKIKHIYNRPFTLAGMDVRTKEDVPEVVKSKKLLSALIDNFEADVLVIDSLSRVMLGDENSAGDANALMNYLRQIAAEKNIGVVLIAHNNKSQTNGGTGSIRGSSAIEAAADIIFNVTKNGVYHNVTNEKTRYKPIEPFSFTIADSTKDGKKGLTLIQTNSGSVEKDTQVKDLIIEEMAKQPPKESFSNKYLEDWLVKGSKKICSDKTFRRAKKDLIDAKLISFTKEGRQTLYFLNDKQHEMAKKQTDQVEEVEIIDFVKGSKPEETKGFLGRSIELLQQKDLDFLEKKGEVFQPKKGEYEVVK